MPLDALMRRRAVKRAGGGSEIRPKPFGADAGKVRDRSRQPSVRRLRKLVCGGAPGGAAPSPRGRASQGRPRKPALPACRTDPRKVRKGPRKPLAPPGAPFPFGERKKGQGVPRAFQRTGAAELDSRPPAVGSGNSLPSCPALCPASTSSFGKQDVDGRDKPGHDEGVDTRVAPAMTTERASHIALKAAATIVRAPMPGPSPSSQRKHP
jgi:hypothetical protein